MHAWKPTLTPFSRTVAASCFPFPSRTTTGVPACTSRSAPTPRPGAVKTVWTSSMITEPLSATGGGGSSRPTQAIIATAPRASTPRQTSTAPRPAALPAPASLVTMRSVIATSGGFRRRARVVLAVVCAGIALAGCGRHHGSGAADRTAPPAHQRLSGALQLVDNSAGYTFGSPCSGHGRASDIRAGTPVVVRDAGNAIIAHG